MTDHPLDPMAYFGAMTDLAGWRQVTCNACGGVVFMRTVGDDGAIETACRDCGEPLPEAEDET